MVIGSGCDGGGVCHAGVDGSVVCCCSLEAVAAALSRSVA